jgi:hypothetical protein
VRLWTEPLSCQYTRLSDPSAIYYKNIGAYIQTPEGTIVWLDEVILFFLCAFTDTLSMSLIVFPSLASNWPVKILIYLYFFSYLHYLACQTCAL